MSDVAVEAINYFSKGIRCSADLYLPAGRKAPGPALVIAFGFSSVKEMSAPVGEFFAKNGYVSMVIDYRSFGGSDGTPRSDLFPLRQVEDVRNAVTYLENRKDVDPNAIGAWGASFGGGVVLQAAGADRRIKAVISELPVVDGDKWQRALRGSFGYEKLLSELEEDRRRRARGESSARIPVTGIGGNETVGHPGDQEVVDLLNGYGKLLPSWSPTMSLESLEKIIEFSPLAMIARISPRPLLMIGVSGYDALHPPAQIVEAFERAREPKEFLVLPYTQFGLYSGDGLQVVLGHKLKFYNKHLPV